MLAFIVGAMTPFAFAVEQPAIAQPTLPPPPPPPLETTARPPQAPPAPTPTTQRQVPTDITVPRPRPRPAATGGPTIDPPAPVESTPDLLTTKRRLDPLDLAEKRDDGYFTGLPLIHSDPDAGIGLGARIYHHWNGRRDDPLFAYTPYLHRTYAQAFVMTNGSHYHALDYDGVYVGHSLYRVRAALAYERNTSANYFGRGASTLEPLAYPGAAGSFSQVSDYETSTNGVQPGGTTFARYNRYSLARPIARASIERDLFGGFVRILGGLGLSYVTIRDYTGANVTAGNGARVPEASTLLQRDCGAARAIGCQDGWNNTLKLGVAYDTRDFEPDPTSGLFADVTGEVSTKIIGSRYDYGRVTASPRVFFSPISGAPPARLVLAARAVYSVAFGDVPFFDMGTLAFTDGDQTGLGGLRTIRGFRQERFVGRITALTSFEVRWTFYDFNVRRERIHLMLVPFLDMGRVFDDVRDTTFAGWKRGQGAALRIGWNQATILSVDYGASAEGAGLYVSFGQPF